MCWKISRHKLVGKFPKWCRSMLVLEVEFGQHGSGHGLDGGDFESSAGDKDQQANPGSFRDEMVKKCKPVGRLAGEGGHGDDCRLRKRWAWSKGMGCWIVAVCHPNPPLLSAFHGCLNCNCRAVYHPNSPLLSAFQGCLNCNCRPQ